MAYKNFILRLIFSFLLFLIYLISIVNIKLLFFIGFTIYVIIFYEVIKNFKKYIFFITFYLLFSLFSFCFYLYNYFDLYYFNLIIFVIITFDTFSYLTGVFFGKKFLFKKISPNKTLEGYLGGVFFTNLFYLVYFYFFEKISASLHFIILINVMILFSLIGDLLQSFFKRKNNIKDSSDFLPGHGGFFDRFDSFISTIILIFFYSYLYS